MGFLFIQSQLFYLLNYDHGSYQLELLCYQGGAEQWDEMIKEANDIYRGRMHNICCDNCHSVRYFLSDCVYCFPSMQPVLTYRHTLLRYCTFIQLYLDIACGLCPQSNVSTISWHTELEYD
jgi:hypothetical protein